LRLFEGDSSRQAAAVGAGTGTVNARAEGDLRPFEPPRSIQIHRLDARAVRKDRRAVMGGFLACISSARCRHAPGRSHPGPGYLGETRRLILCLMFFFPRAAPRRLGPLSDYGGYSIFSRVLFAVECMCFFFFCFVPFGGFATSTAILLTALPMCRRCLLSRVLIPAYHPSYPRGVLVIVFVFVTLGTRAPGFVLFFVCFERSFRLASDLRAPRRLSYFLIQYCVSAQPRRGS